MSFRAVGIQTHCPPDHFSRFFIVPGALNQAGHHQVFRGSLLGVTESFVNHRQVRMGGDMFRIQMGDALPVCESLFCILVLDVKFGGL